MKLNLQCGTDIIEGYKNLDTEPKHKMAEKGDFKVLDVPDDSVEEIRATRVLRLIPLNELGSVLQNWSTKMKKGGRLYLEGVDSSSIGNVMFYDQVTMEEINIALYGTPTESPGRAIYSLVTLEGFLKQFGYITKTKGLLNCNFFLEMEKA